MKTDSNIFLQDIEDSLSMNREILINDSQIHQNSSKLKKSKPLLNLLASIPSFFLNYLVQPLPLWYLFVSVIQLSLNLSPKYPLITILSTFLLFSLSFSLKTEISAYLSKRRQEDSSHLVWTDNKFVNKKRKDLLPGEIILVMQNETVPADVLLIANGSPAQYSYFDVKGVTNQNELDKKTVVKEIQSLIDSVEVNEAGFFLNMIEGKIYMSEPSSDFLLVEGKIRLRNAPTAIKISNKSFVLSESVLKLSPWIFAVVLYSGCETKIEMTRQIEKNSSSKTEKILIKFQIFSIILVLLLTIINFCISYKGPDPFNFESFLTLITIYTFFIPLPLLFILPLLSWLQAIIISRFYPNISFSFPSILNSLGQVDYLVFNRAALIQDPKPKVKALLVYYNFHSIDNESKAELSEATNLLITEPETSLEFIRKNVEDNNIEYFNFIRGLILCTKTYFHNSSNDSIITSQDKSIFDLVRELGISISQRDHKKIIISYNNVEHEYKILAFRNSPGQSKKVRILVESTKNREFLLYVRGPWEVMSELGNSQVTRHIEKLWITNPGVRILAYGYLILSQKQVEKFLYNYNSAKNTLINQDGRIQAVFEEAESKLNWLGFVGIEERTSKADIVAINDFKRAGIKVWLTSADSEECSFSTGLGAEIIERELDIVKIPPAETTEELCCLLQDSINHNIFMDNSKISSKFSIFAGITDREDSEERHSLFYKQRESVMSIQSLRRTSLHPLISQMTKTVNDNFCVSRPFSSDLTTFVLILDGKILELALKSAECLKLLTLLMFVSKTVCFYEMMPHHNLMLDRVLKNCFSFDPVFLSFGDKAIGVKVELKNRLNKKSGFELGVRVLAELKDLILYYGMNFYLKTCKIIKLVIFFNFALASILFVNFYFTKFSGSWVVSEASVYFLVFCLQVIIYFGQLLNGSVLEKQVFEQLTHIYQTGILGQELNMNQLFFFAISGTVTGLLTYFFMLLAFIAEINGSGKVLDSEMIQIYIIVVYGLTIQSCALIDLPKISVRSLFIQILTVSVLLIYILVRNFNADDELFMSLSHFFQSKGLVICLIFNILLNSVIFYCQVRWIQLFSPNLYDVYRSANAFFSIVDYKSRQQTFEDDLGKVYKENSLVDCTHTLITSPINPYKLEFYSKIKECEYNKERSQMYRKTCRTIFALHIVALISLFLYAGISKNTAIWEQVLLFTSACLIFILLILLFTPLYSSSPLFCLKLLYLFFTIAAVISIILLFDTFSSVFSLFPISLIISCTYWWKFTVPLSYLLSILDIYYKSYSIPYSKYLLVEYSLSLLSILTLSAASSYLLEYNKRQEFLLISQIALKNSKANDVLQLLLPSFVISNVKSGIYYISIDQGIISVLFCNICDFESLTSELTPLELTSFLDELYGKFDQLCEMVGVSKIETVGKTYMASAGIKDSDMELDDSLSQIPHARRLIELAFGMLRIVQKTLVRNTKVTIKIGINSGPVRAGVVGFHKPQFSLVGDTVNTASRMASTLKESNSIQISSETYEFVKDCSELVFNKQACYVKGKGNMDTFLVKLMTCPDTGIELFSEKDTTLSSIKGKKFDFGVSISFISLSAMSPGEFIGRKKAGRRLNLAGKWNSRIVKVKTSEMLKKSMVFSCRLQNTKNQDKFRLIVLEKKLDTLYIGLTLGILTHLGILIEELIYKFVNNSQVSLNLISSSVILILFTTLLISLKRYYTKHWFSIIYTSILVVPIILTVLCDVYDSKSSSTTTSIKVSFHVLLITQCSPLHFSHQVIFLIASAIIWLVHFLITPSHAGIVPFIFIILSEVSAYITEIKLKIFSKLSTSGQKELNKLENLLTQMVPPHAYEHLKAESTVIDKLFQVTLLYADIVGFTAWSSDKTPEEVVKMLNEMFTRFDKMCVNHSVYKVHTIGDCYVAMGNAGSNNRDIGQECVNVLTFASKMIQVIQEVNNEYNMGINMRIGIHTGDVIAGITGKSIVRYDIYGNDVYIANMMESNGMSGEIAVSKTTMNLVKNFRPSLMNFESHKTVEVFGENIEMFFAKFN